MLLRATGHAAANLLVNPEFRGQTAATSSRPAGRILRRPTRPVQDYWIATTIPPAARIRLRTRERIIGRNGVLIHNGTNNVAGIYQDFSSTPGSIYQASGWFFTEKQRPLGPDCAVWSRCVPRLEHQSAGPLQVGSALSASVGTDNWFQYQVTNACDSRHPVSDRRSLFHHLRRHGLGQPVGRAARDHIGPLPVCYVQVGSEGGSCLFRQRRAEPGQRPGPAASSATFSRKNMIFVNPVRHQLQRQFPKRLHHQQQRHPPGRQRH